MTSCNRRFSSTSGDSNKRPMPTCFSQAEPVKVKYNMSSIPAFQRNLKFLEHARFFDGKMYSGRRKSSSCRSDSNFCTNYIRQGKVSTSSPEDQPETKINRTPTKDNEETKGKNRTLKPVSNNKDLINHISKDKHVITVPSFPPFSLMPSSVIWVPPTRKHWENSADEMAALCAYAAHRRKPNSPILPKIYIEERIDIDDPLRGFQIRDARGYLQGFIMTTTFTTWQYYFKWDSLHPKSGMMGGGGRDSIWDEEGSFSGELEIQPRSGDPQEGGVVWPTIAEISIVGGTGCGEYLIRMALDDIARQGCYKYVVLQATETSYKFYEKFGFQRVGAVTRYGGRKGRGRPIVGYRHWTFPNERHWRNYGGPSYMMARRIGGSEGGFSFLDALSECFVSEKPRIKTCNGRMNVEKGGRFVCTVENEVHGDNDVGGNSMMSNELGLLRNKRRLDHNVSQETTTNKNKLNHTPDTCRVIPEEAKLTKVHKRKRKRSEILRPTYTQTTSTIEPLPESKKLKTPETITSSPAPVILKNKKLPIVLTSAKKTYKQSAPIPRKILASKIPTLIKLSSNRDTVLKKQKATYSRRRSCDALFFNKVVARKDTPRTPSSYYFVLHFDLPSQRMKMVKLEPRGKFSGKRDGRIKFRALLEVVQEANCDGWEVVKSSVVSKTSSVAEESWDIVDEKMTI
eukprot:CAMPEP_0172522436 /NCGR_PEP_ID=MMETSP1066-20121228/293123_1 /TAXON_ID=671091 /ORGANISM="Coscinodiscus wailesii, Strain CCMP2513" /LENGTH=683 /DNA_ID=CAMNT_0013305435 /DNA_START=309 /DNA_END=2360 /DNA_ORIENTATION=-